VAQGENVRAMRWTGRIAIAFDAIVRHVNTSYLAVNPAVARRALETLLRRAQVILKVPAAVHHAKAALVAAVQHASIIRAAAVQQAQPVVAAVPLAQRKKDTQRRKRVPRKRKEVQRVKDDHPVRQAQVVLRVQAVRQAVRPVLRVHQVQAVRPVQAVLRVHQVQVVHPAALRVLVNHHQVIRKLKRRPAKSIRNNLQVRNMFILQKPKAMRLDIRKRKGRQNHTILQKIHPRMIRNQRQNTVKNQRIPENNLLQVHQRVLNNLNGILHMSLLRNLQVVVTGRSQRVTGIEIHPMTMTPILQIIVRNSAVFI